MKRILCFGDSNTWGFVAESPNRGKRHPSSIRWTGHLQSLSQDRYQIIEEGLNSRTTALEDPDKAGKNGLTYFEPCLESHLPLDGVVIMLGTNDLKKKYRSPATDIRDRMRLLIQKAKSLARTEDGHPSQIWIVGLPILLESPIYEDYRYPELNAKQMELHSLYEPLAKDEGVHFLSLQNRIDSSHEDGIHWSGENHQKFAKIVNDALSLIL